LNKSSTFYNGANILVTGGSGFVGTNLALYLKSLGAHVKIASRGQKKNYLSSELTIMTGDTTDFEFCKQIVKDIDFVFHLAAEGFTSISNPKLAAKTFNDNILMNANVLRASFQSGVKRFLFASSGSVYPPNNNLLEEEEAWNGNPHQAEWYFAWTKRLGELQCKAIFESEGFPTAICRIGAVYGPYDNFDPTTARVIPALIYRVTSRENPLVIWGSGNAIRNFIYVEDVVRGLCQTLENYVIADPLNITSPTATKIKELVEIIADIANYKGELFFDASKPEGNPYKIMSHKKTLEKINFLAEVSPREGLIDTIEWYRNNILKKFN
jgi:GDP-L-fucose synthase